ncbi:MAG: transcription repressor NadR, partial [Lysinibacillus sp.]
LLQKRGAPITGTELAQFANVSRQVIVNDMNLLKAKNEPIMSTSQGYYYFSQQPDATLSKKIVCFHGPQDAKDELYSIVDCGATVNNVIVEHPIYGEMTATLQLANRLEVDRFIQQVTTHNAGLLSSLTDGTHIHTISAPTEEQLNSAINSLRAKGYLVEQ